MRTERILPILAAALLATGCVLLLAACASTSRFEGPDGDRRLYNARCGFCHVPFAPSDFHPDDWPAIVADMSARSGLSAEYRARVERYLVTEARKAWGGPEPK